MARLNFDSFQVLLNRSTTLAAAAAEQISTQKCATIAVSRALTGVVENYRLKKY